MGAAEGTFVSSATTVDRFPMYVDVLPYLVYRTDLQSAHNVEGEIFSVPADGVVNVLDRLEGHPHWYRRALIQVRNPAGEKSMVWAYFICPQFLPRKWEFLKFQPSFCPNYKYANHSERTSGLHGASAPERSGV